MRPRWLPIARLVAGASVLWVAVSLGKALLAATPQVPSHARYAFVLDGQGVDRSRTREGLALLRAGTVDTLVVSGTDAGEGVSYSMLWVRGLPLTPSERSRVLELRSGSQSTQDEARLADSIFPLLKSDSVIVVTSAYHAWRTNSVLRKLCRSGTVLSVKPSSDRQWNEGLSTREGMKMRVMEWSKRAFWVFWEQWLPVGGGLPWCTLVRGDQVGVLPDPAWTER